jgi:hypothetical protein
MTSRMPDDGTFDALYELHQQARTLLGYLLECRLKAGGASFHITPDPSLRSAAKLLTELGFAEYVGQVEITSTALGVRAIRDDDMLDEHLPVRRLDRGVEGDGMIQAAEAPVDRPSLGLVYPPSCPDDALQAFLGDLAAQGISVPVRREDRGPQAGMEDWLPTVAVLFMAHGFLAAAGKDTYDALKRAVARFWPVFFGEDRQMQTRVVVSGSKKLSTSGFSRAFCLMARTTQGTVKLALRDEATREELDEALSAFLPFLEQVYAGEQQLRYSGSIALVAYNVTPPGPACRDRVAGVRGVSAEVLRHAEVTRRVGLLLAPLERSGCPRGARRAGALGRAGGRLRRSARSRRATPLRVASSARRERRAYQLPRGGHRGAGAPDRLV